jgi:hypothetical protein
MSQTWARRICHPPSSPAARSLHPKYYRDWKACSGSFGEMMRPPAVCTLWMYALRGCISKTTGWTTEMRTSSQARVNADGQSSCPESRVEVRSSMFFRQHVSMCGAHHTRGSRWFCEPRGWAGSAPREEGPNSVFTPRRSFVLVWDAGLTAT